MSLVQKINTNHCNSRGDQQYKVVLWTTAARISFVWPPLFTWFRWSDEWNVKAGFLFFWFQIRVAYCGLPQSAVPSVDSSDETMDCDVKAEPEATQLTPSGGTSTIDLTYVNNHRDSPIKESTVLDEYKHESCGDSANATVHDTSSDVTRQPVQMASDEDVVNKDIIPKPSADSSGSVPVEKVSPPAGLNESEAFVDNIHTEDDSAKHIEMSDSDTKGNVDDDVFESTDPPSNNMSYDDGNVGSNDRACEIQKESQGNNGKMQQNNGGRDFPQPERDLTDDDDDFEITFGVQSTREGIERVEVTQNAVKRMPYGLTEHYGKGAGSTANDVGGIGMGIHRVYMNPHHGAHYFRHGYGDYKTRYTWSHIWGKYPSFPSEMGRGYHGNHIVQRGFYGGLESPHGGRSRVGSGRGLDIHNREAWGNGTFHQLEMHNKNFPPPQTEYQKPWGQGWAVAKGTNDTAKCNDTSNAIATRTRHVSPDLLCPIKSYQKKREVSLPKKDPNEKCWISYDVWYHQLGTDYMEKVKGYPNQNVILKNLVAATCYEVLITKRGYGEEISMSKHRVSTTPLDPPDNFSAKRDSNGEVRLEWHESDITAPDDYIVEYVVTVNNYLECDVPQGQQFRYDRSIHAATLQLDAETSYIFQIDARSRYHISETSKAEILMPKREMLKKGIKMGTKGKPVYLLNMTDSTVGHGKICRKRLGSPPVSGITLNEKVVLVVGATGSGKTTWINAMLNYILDVKYTDKFRFKLVIDVDASNQAISQTQHITIYTIHHQNGFKIDYTLTIIDTPGFGDTRGIQKDKEIELELSKCSEIHALYTGTLPRGSLQPSL